MNLKDSGLIETILPIGILLIAWKAVSSFLPGGSGGPGEPGGTGDTYKNETGSTCPAGYHRIFGLSFLKCEPDEPSSNPPPPESEPLPTLSMCNQLFSQTGEWDFKCIIAGYPAPPPPTLPENTNPFTGKPWQCGVSPYLPECLT